MLILDSKEVKHCQIRSAKSAQGYAGVTYRNLLFVKSRPFPDARRKEALRLCQETLDAGQFCILVKEPDRYTFCYQIPSAPAPQTTSTARPAVAPPPMPARKPQQALEGNRTILQLPQPSPRGERTMAQPPTPTPEQVRSRHENRTILQPPRF